MVNCDDQVKIYSLQESNNADYHQYSITATEESNQQFQVDQVPI